jgi:hypothetical protein
MADGTSHPRRFAYRAEQCAARKRVAAVAEPGSRAISQVFNAGIELAARENPNSHSEHFCLMFAHAVREQTAHFDRY